MRVVTEEAWVWHAVFVAVVVLLLVDLVVVFSVVNLSQDAPNVLLHRLLDLGESQVVAGELEVGLLLGRPVGGEMLLQVGLRGEEGVADLAPEVSPQAGHDGGGGPRGRLRVDRDPTSHPQSLPGEGRQDGLTAWPGDVQVLAEVVSHVLLHHHGTAAPALPVLGPPVLLQVSSGGENFTTISAGNFLFVCSVLTNSLEEK